ncbi:MAG: phospholipase D-like domain-containing protein [Desulfurivibrionaceae bacterium]
MQTFKARKSGLLRIFYHPSYTVSIIFLFILIWPLAASGLDKQLDLNTASKKELKELPFIGSDRAEAITDYRREKGSFKNLDQLLQIEGIGETSLQAISPYLSINGEKAGKSAPGNFSVQRRIDLAPGAIMVLPDDKYYQALTDFIRKAEKSIDMAMYLFKITDSPQNQARLLMKELIKARKRGVMVRLVLERSDYNDGLNQENRRVARQLKKKRVQVSFDGQETTSHSKVAVIDRRFTFLGSHNLTHSALSYNHEMSILIDNKNLAEEMIDHINEIELGK